MRWLVVEYVRHLTNYLDNTVLSAVVDIGWSRGLYFVRVITCTSIVADIDSDQKPQSNFCCH